MMLNLSIHIRRLFVGAAYSGLIYMSSGCTPEGHTQTQFDENAVASTSPWQLIWSDEFDEDGPPNPQHWGYEEGFVRNRELQLYTRRPENVWIKDGHLVLEAARETVPNPDYAPMDADQGRNAWIRQRETAEYTSAALTTKGLQEFRYGRVEVRAKLPEGRGMWPAIWMLAHDIGEVKWPDCGEIDIMEYVGHIPHTIHGAVHTGQKNHLNKNHPSTRVKLDNLHEQFNLYAIEWSADRLDFYVNDNNYMTYVNDGEGQGTWPFDKPYYLIMNIAVGGTWGGTAGVDGIIFPQRMHIDYVRVYQARP